MCDDMRSWKLKFDGGEHINANMEQYKKEAGN